MQWKVISARADRRKCSVEALIARGLSFGGNILLTRTIAILTGPVGWTISGVWTAVDIAGAAYRVTIPAAIQIAALRQQQIYGDMAEQVKFG